MGAGIRLRTRLIAWLGVLAGLAVFALTVGRDARASAPPSPWDGTNPFNCTIQDAGTGTAVPDPGADPYCVQFDKTHQNVTEMGLVDFLGKEPSRVAAASPKCFYFQQDHWRGSLIQSDGRTVLYEFHGHYFFDKATGDGGVFVTGFAIGGQTFDPTTLPGFPPGEGQYFGPGTGGMITHDDVPADPACGARAAQNPTSIYAARANVPRCVATPATIVARRLGPITLGETEDRVRAALGPPVSVQRGYLHYCAVGGYKLLVGEPGDRSGTLGGAGTAPAVIVLTTNKRFVLRGQNRRAVVVGADARAMWRAFPRARRLIRTGQTVAYRVATGDTLVGIRSGRVRYIAVYDPKAIRNLRALSDYVTRA
jgi:hypothetical protein